MPIKTTEVSDMREGKGISSNNKQQIKLMFLFKGSMTLFSCKHYHYFVLPRNPFSSKSIVFLEDSCFISAIYEWISRA
jgi:hypothetical protein